MKLTVVIPVCNEKNTLEELVAKVQAVDIKGGKELILIDDFSTDGTRDIEDKLVKKYKNLKVFKQDKNYGKGAALRVGFKNAMGEYIIIQDADLEYDPEDYHSLLTLVERNKNSVIYGSRFLGAERRSMSLTHTLGNKLLTMLTNVLYNTSITDMETCYKMFPRELIQSIEYHSNRFNFEPEITAKILKRGYKIFEVPIKYYGRDWDEGKKISWKDGFAAIWAIVKYRFVD